MLKSHSDFLKDQIISKDQVINSLVGNSKSPALTKDVGHQDQQKANEVGDQVLIMGDSIIKLIEPEKLLFRNPEIKVTKASAYTWDDAIEAAKEPTQPIPNNVVLHIGTNDIRDGKPVDSIL